MSEAETEAEDAPDEGTDTENALSEGDLVLVNFEAWTEEGRLFDTTRKEAADEAGWDVDEELEPMPVLLGEERVVPGFEEAILEAEVGEETEVDVPPTKAFGMYDDDRVETFSKRDFEKKGIEPEPGTPVEINGRQGTVLQATASRVRVDFNHPFAGKTLSYTFTVEEELTDPADTVHALIGLDYDREDAEGFEVTVEDGHATVVVPDDASFDAQWFMARHRLSHDVFDHTDLDEVTFEDTVTREAVEEHEHGHGHGPAATAPQSAATGAFEG